MKILNKYFKKRKKEEEDDEDFLRKLVTPEEYDAIKLHDYFLTDEGFQKFREIIAWVIILIPYVIFIHVIILLCRECFGS